MFTDASPRVLCALAGALSLAWLLAALWRLSACGVRRALGFVRRQPVFARVLLAVFVLALWSFAGVKPPSGGGGEGTNSVPRAAARPGPGGPAPAAGGADDAAGGVPEYGGGTDGGPLAPGVGEGGTPSAAEPTAPVNTARSLTDGDFARGFVMTRVGLDEVHDFSPPAGAVVCADWRAFGAATDWIYVAFTNWAFRIAANDVDRLRVHSFGRIEPLIRGADGSIATNSWFAPFSASLGIVPQANWSRLDESDRPSQVWYATTPDGSLVVTWQNALLDRDTGKPISFQMECKTDGRFIYRYDLSRLDVGAVTNILAGASLGGAAWTTNALPASVTSMAFHPLAEADRFDQDPDGDGLATADELFVHGTSPHAADTDCDGLTDWEEVFVHGTDPLDPRSAGSGCGDGFAVRTGGLDPLSRLEGSTNTVLEHVFYSGTTNGAFAYPQPSVDASVLEISVSGTGEGRLVVGDAVVPLVGPSAASGVLETMGLGPAQLMGGGTRAASSGGEPSAAAPTNTLLLAVGRGARRTVWWEKPDGLDVALRSGDLMIGSLPTRYRPRGWIAFPHTDATEPCIHDLCARGKVVSLVHGEEFAGLTATWRAGAGGVAVTNAPPVSAVVHGSFPTRESRSISYTVDHPDRLNAQAPAFAQTLRFCPQPSEEELPPPGGAGGGGDDDQCRHCDCAPGGACDCCGEWCHCGNWDCPCNAGRDATLGDDEEAEDAFTNIVAGALQPMADVFCLYRANTRTVHLDVPGGEPARCCPCPEHWASNYVAGAVNSSRVAVDRPDGSGPFDISYEPCDVTLSGVSPSRDFGDATVLFVTNGAVASRRDCTVLGVRIERPRWSAPLSDYNRLSPSLGFPVEVCTNMGEAASLVLHTDVLLTNGTVRVALEDADCDMQLWLQGWWDSNGGYHAPEKLLDSSTRPERCVSMRRWRGIINRYSSSCELEVKVLSSSEGSCRLKFEYAASDGERYVHDFAQQRISSISPVLLGDYNHDGRIDATDAAFRKQGLSLRFWHSDYDASNPRVDGVGDLIDLFPVGVDLARLLDAWGTSSVNYSVALEYANRQTMAFAPVRCPWNRVGSMQTNVLYVAGERGVALTNAPLTQFGGEWIDVPNDALADFTPSSGILALKARGACHGRLLLRATKSGDGAELYRASLPLSITSVRDMYRWITDRGSSGQTPVRPTDLGEPRNAPYGVESARRFFFLHGANVSEADAGLWGDEIFKRLWHAGANVDFCNVDWRSDIGGSANYHQNASNAFEVAAHLAPILSKIPGEKVVMAHSLGNMVVSSMIQDYGLQVSRYIMCNSAVPAEAYDDSLATTNVLIHPAWNDYPEEGFAANWSALWEDADDRSRLAWAGRFSNVVPVAVNLYSSGDEVLELNDDCDIDLLTGILSSPARYAWHKQELFKGRGDFSGGGVTDWAGWGFRMTPVGEVAIDAQKASSMQPEEFRTNTVFKLYPASMNTNAIPLLVRAAHLTHGIPALTPAAGAIAWEKDDLQELFYDLNNTDEALRGISRPNGWPNRTGFLSEWRADRWLHSDLKDVPYYYNFNAYRKISEIGGVR